jgi:tRNA threonylcarbamoyladenosine biosynthesis protein TsaB
MEKDTIILSADTSSERFSLALLRNKKVIGRFKAIAPNRQSSDMLPETDRLLKTKALNIKDIGLFCVGLGPGSFTGLRIGVTAMRTMALALDRPIVGVPSIDAIAHNVPYRKEMLCVITDAKQGKVYARLYKYRNSVLVSSSGIILVEIKDLLDKLKVPVFFLGDGIKVYKDAISIRGAGKNILASEAMWYPDAGIIGELGAQRFRKKGKDNVFTLNPLYVYSKECQVVKKKTGTK